MELIPRRSGGEEGGKEDAIENSEEEVDPLEGIASDLEEIVLERRKIREKGSKDADWEEQGEIEGTGGGGANSVLDSIEEMSLPAQQRNDHDDTSSFMTTTLHSLSRNPFDTPILLEAQDEEEDSSSWNPEVYTSMVVSQGAGGGPRRLNGHSTSLKGKRRVIYEVPEEGESWDSKASIEMVENIEPRLGSLWSFDKPISSNIHARTKDNEEEKQMSRAQGRTRANERLKMVTDQLSWTT
jgi:hypothetical protein